MASRSLSDLATAQSGHGGSITVRFESDVAIITMDRGENRLNHEFVDQMNAALDEALRNPNMMAIITTGKPGSKFFSNGLDLAYLSEAKKTSMSVLESFSKCWSALNLRLLTLPVLTVAAINGHAFAGGCVLSLVHDVRIMQTDRGWWCLNEAHLGLNFPTCIIRLVRMKLGSNGARGLIQSTIYGRRFTAEEAKEFGIVDEICASSELISKAQSYVSTVISSPISRQFVASTKEQIYEEIIPTIVDFNFQAYDFSGSKL